jgi:hypothetical protein
MEALILVADLGGPTMFARIGVMRALNRQRVFDPSRRTRPIAQVVRRIFTAYWFL